MLRLRNKRIEANVMAGMLRRKWVWLRRIGHCKGFGVQSPWAYGMVTTVINGRGRQDAYERLNEEFAGLCHIDRKLSEMYLRLADRLKPEAVIDTAEDGEAFKAYTHEGCPGADMVTAKDGETLSAALARLSDKDNRTLIRLTTGGDMQQRFEIIRQHGRDGWAVAVEGIHLDKNMSELWQSIAGELAGVVTFDLYYCGLVFFDRKRYKQNYIINF